MPTLTDTLDCLDVIVPNLQEHNGVNPLDSLYKSSKKINQHLKNSVIYYKSLINILERIAKFHYEEKKRYSEKYYMLKSHLQYITYNLSDIEDVILHDSGSDEESDEGYIW
tara:strand:- start:448 stop:780 length:333 start_codon:yes stop_codon:yes gene_type:complete